MLEFLSASSALSHTDFSLLFGQYFSFACYLVVCTVLAFLLGHLFRKAAVKWGWDTKYYILRIHSEWYYALGENYLRRFGISNVLIDVKINDGKTPLIYSGILKEFYLSDSKELDRLSIYSVVKRDAEGPWTSEDVVEVPGYLMFIPYNTMQNMNLTYLHKGSVRDQV